MAEEAKLEAKFRTGVSKKGGTAIKISCMWFTGLPDRLVLIPMGRIYFVELKAPGKWVKKGSRQEFVIDWLRKIGFQVFIINDEYKLQLFLDQIKIAEA